jgi:DNA polymerase-3 subunit chi
MGAAYFYHLTRKPLEQTLPVLLEKALQAGWSIEVRGSDPDLIGRLDHDLWKWPEDGFIPHEISGAARDMSAPVVLSTSPISTARECIMSVGGAHISPSEINACERVCILFDGHDPSAIEHARVQWKTIADAGCAAQYWSEDSGQWKKMAQSGSET